MDFCKVRADAHLRRTIVDRFNEIPAKAKIGFDKAVDAEHWTVDPGGLVVIPRGETVPR